MEDKASTWEIALLRLGMPFRNYLLFFAFPVSLVGLVAGLAALLAPRALVQAHKLPYPHDVRVPHEAPVGSGIFLHVHGHVRVDYQITPTRITPNLCN